MIDREEHINIYETDVHNVNSLPIKFEKTSFRLTSVELDIIVHEYEYKRINLNSVSKTCFLLNDKRLDRIRQFVDNRMKNYIKYTTGIDNEFQMVQSWSAISKKNEEHHAHAHPSAIFSIVLYVKSCDSKLIFMSESRVREKFFFPYSISNQNAFNSNSWSYEMNTGDIIMFPGWLQHKTEKNKNDDDKIVIGANYFIKGIVGSVASIDQINIQLGDCE